jgi:hypothetical protein
MCNYIFRNSRPFYGAFQFWRILTGFKNLSGFKRLVKNDLKNHDFPNNLSKELVATK